jgi:hypothetical protein
MLQTGPSAELSDEEYAMYVQVFDLDQMPFFSCFHKPDTAKKTIAHVYTKIENKLKTIRGPCSQTML